MNIGLISGDDDVDVKFVKKSNMRKLGEFIETNKTNIFNLIIIILVMVMTILSQQQFNSMNNNLSSAQEQVGIIRGQMMTYSGILNDITSSKVDLTLISEYLKGLKFNWIGSGFGFNENITCDVTFQRYHPVLNFLLGGFEVGVMRFEIDIESNFSGFGVIFCYDSLGNPNYTKLINVQSNNTTSKQIDVRIKSGFNQWSRCDFCVFSDCTVSDSKIFFVTINILAS